MARAGLVAPDRGEDRNDHDRDDDREAALGAGDLLVRLVIRGASGGRASFARREIGRAHV